MKRFNRLWPLLLIVALVFLLSTAMPVLGQGGRPTVDTSSLSLAVGEIRDAVPFGKDDASFGVVSEPLEGTLFPPATPIQVRLRATKAPQLNEAINVVLEVYAAEEAPGTMAEIQLPEGVQVLAGSTSAQFDLAAGQTAELPVSIVFTQVGEYAIEGRALTPVNSDMVWGDMDGLYLTVGQDAGFAGFASGEQPLLSTGLEMLDTPNMLIGPPEELMDELALSGEEEALALEEASLPADLMAGQPIPDRAGPSPKEKENAKKAEPEVTVDISICWILGSDRDGSSPPLRDAYIELWDEDSGADDLLASGYTNYWNGCKTFSLDNTDTDECCTIDAYFNVYMYHSGSYRVTNYGNGIFWGHTTTEWNILGDYNFGTWWIGGGAGNDRSIRIFNDLYRARRFIRDQAALVGMGGYPGEVWVLWETGGADGTYYSLGDGKVHLKDADAASRDTVVHEANHSYMDDIYTSWPPWDCPSPHYINRVSGCGCGWSEGWTYMIVAAADANPVYTWPSGATLNLERHRCDTANWDDGPQVEGRVGGVLIDMVDPARIWYDTWSGMWNGEQGGGCNGEDRSSGMFDAIWDLIYDQDDQVFVSCGGYTNSFSNAWEARQYPRYGPGEVGDLNSIDTFTHD